MHRSLCTGSVTSLRYYNLIRKGRPTLVLSDLELWKDDGFVWNGQAGVMTQSSNEMRKSCIYW